MMMSVLLLSLACEPMEPTQQQITESPPTEENPSQNEIGQTPDLSLFYMDPVGYGEHDTPFTKDTCNFTTNLSTDAIMAIYTVVSIDSINTDACFPYQNGMYFTTIKINHLIHGHISSEIMHIAMDPLSIGRVTEGNTYLSVIRPIEGILYTRNGLRIYYANDEYQQNTGNYDRYISMPNTLTELIQETQEITNNREAFCHRDITPYETAAKYLLDHPACAFARENRD